MQSRHLVGNFSRQCPVCKKAPAFLHLRKRRGFFVTVLGGTEQGRSLASGHIARQCVLCRGTGENALPGSCFFAGRRAKAVSRQFGRPWLGVVAEKSWLFTAHGRDAARPDTAPSRLPGACAASAPRAGHWRTRLRYRRHWPPGPWRNGRIWNCPWPGRPGASIR